MFGKHNLAVPFVYAITDEVSFSGERVVHLVERAIVGGVCVVQYRAKRKTSRVMLEEATAIRAVTKKYGVIFIVNDRLDVALLCGADGLHVGQDDLPVEDVRKFVGDDFIIGLSTHSIDQVERANLKPVDYIGFGPVFETVEKPDLEPTGVDMLCRAAKVSVHPVVAVGGINAGNIASVLSCEPSGVACMGAIFDGGDPFYRVKELVRFVEKH